MKNQAHNIINSGRLSPEVNTERVYRMLGYNRDNIPDFFVEELNSGLVTIGSLKDAGWIIKLFNDYTFSRDMIFIGNTRLNPGKKIIDNIKHAECLAVFICTAGKGLSSLINEYSQGGEVLKTYLFDILGIEMISGLIESIYQSLKDQSSTGLSDVFSPGHCGWNIKDQMEIFGLLSDVNSIVSLNEYFLMQPVKSLSGLIGLGESMQRSHSLCDICDNIECNFRNIYTADV